SVETEADCEPMKAPWPSAGRVGSGALGPTAQAASRAADPAAVSRVRSLPFILRISLARSGGRRFRAVGVKGVVRRSAEAGGELALLARRLGQLARHPATDDVEDRGEDQTEEGHPQHPVDH